MVKAAILWEKSHFSCMVRELGSEPEGCTMWPWVLLWLQETSYGWCSARLFQGLGFFKCGIRCLLFLYISDPLCLSVCVCLCAYFRISEDNSTTQTLFLQTAWKQIHPHQICVGRASIVKSESELHQKNLFFFLFTPQEAKPSSGLWVVLCTAAVRTASVL